ncbi:hypothetical protein EG346_17735 [Chryseobacterium carnipullorum]|uniref:Colicin immunity protein / pyocin immunity protein n=2 Tax=Chryseobacterium carnipullorum TaxID=1124835 RepID=A0A3G6NG29_CHRCU|nr:hypothetical protein EG346_17735 [Chryseobacterium carnipullorum]AZA64785.1 hypothetical protein EG345_08760 [Chryseobacterium carnipullorum]
MIMNKDELIQLAKDILNAIGKNEEENEAMLQRFLDNVPDPNASNLFFSLEYEDLEAEDIVEKAFSYKPI